nr:hypothetical protein [Actinomycetota bacterium]
LLITRLALPGPASQEQAAAAVLIASTIAAIVAAWLLRRRPTALERQAEHGSSPLPVDAVRGGGRAGRGGVFNLAVPSLSVSIVVTPCG